jgi:hypothetical protein
MIEIIIPTDRSAGKTTPTWGIGGARVGTAALGCPAERSSAVKQLLSLK